MTAYYTNDFNDVHGDLFGTQTLGYLDDWFLWATTSLNWKPPLNFSSSYYKSVDARSNLIPVDLYLEGPWYFSMTTPFKYIEEVMGIHEAPDALEFPDATYAVRVLIIGSGGCRISGISYRSNDAQEQRWYEYGVTFEVFPSN